MAHLLCVCAPLCSVQGVAGKRGPILLFSPLTVSPSSSAHRRCIPAGPDKTAAIAMQPGSFFVQCYTVQRKQGTMRGQLRADFTSL